VRHSLSTILGRWYTKAARVSRRHCRRVVFQRGCRFAPSAGMNAFDESIRPVEQIAHERHGIGPASSRAGWARPYAGKLCSKGRFMPGSTSMQRSMSGTIASRSARRTVHVGPGPDPPRTPRTCGPATVPWCPSCTGAAIPRRLQRSNALMRLHRSWRACYGPSSFRSRFPVDDPKALDSHLQER
jgi:hypothetical protein